MSARDKTLEIILAVVMVGTAFALGGVQTLSYSLMELVLFAAVLWLVLSQTRAGHIRLWLPIWPLLFALLSLLQTIPLPSSWVANSPMRKLDPGFAGLWPNGWPYATLSIYPHDTMIMLLKFLAYLSAFLLAAHLFDSRLGKSTLIRALIFVGVFEAIYGIVQYTTGWQKIFGYTKKYYVEDATGTYINRNHFAGVLGLTIPFAVAMAFYLFQKRHEAHWNGSYSGQRSSGERGAAGSRIVFYLFLTVIMLVGLVFSRSRGGILAVVISLIFIALLGHIRLERKTWTLAILFILVLMTGYGLWVGLGPVLSRFEQLEGTNALTTEGRVSIFRDSTHLIRDHLAMGTGLGTYGTAIRAYQTTRVESELVHAHDDYVEVVADMGLPGAALLFLPIFYLFFKMIGAFLDDPRRFRRSIVLGCAGSTLAILIHSAVDFNLRIPANALIFAVVLGVGYKAAVIERREGQYDLPGNEWQE